MIRIAYWAQTHPRLSRVLLILSNLLLVMVAIRLGLALDLTGMTIPAGWPEAAAIGVAIGFGIYPYGKRRSRSTFRRRKFAEGLMLTSTVLGIALLSAQLVAEPVVSATASRGVSASARFTALADRATTRTVPAPAPQELRGKEKRVWRRGLRAKARTYLREQQKRIDGWGAGLLLLLTAFLALSLETLILALSCTIACNGAGGAAVVVALLGTAGVVYLTFLAVRAILRALRRNNNPDDDKIYRKSPRKKVLE